MPPKTINLLLNRLIEQARQSNSKGGSRAEPLILHSIDFGAGLNDEKVGRVHCRTKKLLDLKGLSFNQQARLNYLSNLDSDATKTIDFLSNRLVEQARQSNSKGGSPAEPLILNSIDFGGGLSNIKAFGSINCETKRLLG